ncbi:DUF6596 domain-containing protein [Gemmatimonas aurantiaca]|uniref:RNA polymerase sigma factor n=1 Tax=Gemmatimonas aurantiaca TaxID=173480 RepID=UPI00301BA840
MKEGHGMGSDDGVDSPVIMPRYPEDSGSHPESTSTADSTSADAGETARLLAGPRGFRDAAARLTAILVRQYGTGQLDRIEDAAQDAFVAAARSWPVAGAPRDAMAWLVQVARRRYLDRLRAEHRLEPSPDTVAAALASAVSPPDVDTDDQLEIAPLADDQLRLLFLCCHPALSAESRVALTLKCVAQFSVAEIARLLRADSTAVAQRLVRAKRTLRGVRTSFVVPSPAELPNRLDDVHAVCYAIFAEGHLATDGELLVRPELCGEAIHLVYQLLRWPVTNTPAGQALLALMLLNAARLSTRSADGTPVPLAEQDRSRWDRASIARGVRAFARSAAGDHLSRYHVEAEIAMAHATAPTFADTPWRMIVDAYDRLLRIAPSPVAQLARLMAIAESGEVTTALAEAHVLPETVRRWPEWQATVATLLTRAGCSDEARTYWEAALAAPLPDPVRRYYRRVSGIGEPGSG